MRPKAHRQPLTYAEAGVDIHAANQLVERIKPLIKATRVPGVETDTEHAGFGAVFNLAKTATPSGSRLVASTDGCGTKVELAWTLNKHETIGIDLVGMCVNDLLPQGAKPLFFLDYFATGKLDNDTAATVIASVAEGCKQAGCALVGGETAEMPGMYDGAYDLAGFTVGSIVHDLSPSSIKPGDVVIGLASTGAHSNGYSLIRHIVKSAKLNLSQPVVGFTDKRPLGDILMTPTRIYVNDLMPALATGKVKGCAHITGGGWVDNPPRILPKGTAIRFKPDYQVPELFRFLQNAGNVTWPEMFKTLNMGVGMMVVTAPEHADSVLETLRTSGATTVGIIGEVTAHQPGFHKVILPDICR